MKKQTLIALAICALASSAFAQAPQGRPSGMQPPPPKELPFPEMKATVLKNITARITEMTTVKACFEKAANKEAFDTCRPHRPQMQMKQGQPSQPGLGASNGKTDFKQFMQQQKNKGVGAPTPGQAR